MNKNQQLYQQVLLDHNKNPRNFGVMEDPTHTAKGSNPLCGDKLELYLKVSDDGIIEELRFDGSGCAISKSSASIMTTLLKGKTVEEAMETFDIFHQMVTSENYDKDAVSKKLGKLRVFEGVRQFPSRTKCATLAWHALKEALASDD